jgi:hypothetical protein
MLLPVNQYGGRSVGACGRLQEVRRPDLETLEVNSVGNIGNIVLYMEMHMKMKIVARVKSKSNPRRVYKLVQIGPRRRDVSCPCLGFRFAHGPIGSKTKRCRHFEEAGL